jgi:hypothetical protein
MSKEQNNYQWHGEDIAENGTENQNKTNTSYTFLSFYQPSSFAIFNAHLGFLSLFPFPRFPSLQVPASNFYFHWY